MKQLRRNHVFNYIFNNYDLFLDPDGNIYHGRLARSAAEHFRDLGFDAFQDVFGSEHPNAMIVACVSYITEAYNSPFVGAPPRSEVNSQ